LKICFPDRERQRLYSQGAKLIRHYGQDLTHLIQCHLSVLKAAANLAAVPCDRLFDLRAEAGVNNYSIRLDEKQRLYFRALCLSGALLAPAAVVHIQIFGIDLPSSTKVFA
jgi:plasmid maintenance system killer protein